MDQRQALERFAAQPVARFATVGPDGRPHLVPVTFAVVEFISHRLKHGGKGTTMDSHHEPEPLHSGDDEPSAEPEGGQA